MTWRAGVFGPARLLCHFYLLTDAASLRYADQASSSGGTTVVRPCLSAFAIAHLTSAALALGNSDHKSAIVPVTNGAAALVPPKVTGCDSGPQTRDTDAGCAQALSPHRTAQIRTACRPSSLVTGNHRNHATVAHERRAADSRLVTARRDDDDFTHGRVGQGLLDRPLALAGRPLHTALILTTRAS